MLMRYKNLSDDELKDALNHVVFDSITRIRKSIELSKSKRCLTKHKEKDNERTR